MTKPTETAAEPSIEDAAAAAAPGESAPAAEAVESKKPATSSQSTDITAGPGGVMTDEVGVITGELTVCTEVAESGKLTVHVQYKEADEWYVITGGRATLKDPADLDAVHKIVVGILNRPEG
jgi:hypothetical protein